MRIERLNIILAVVMSMAMCCLISCTDECSTDVNEKHPGLDDNDHMSFYLDSRSEDDIELTNCTFRIVTYNVNYYTKDQTGTFVFQNEENKLGQVVLTPYPLLDNGDIDDDDKSTLSDSIIRKDDAYNVVVVSPGIKCNIDGSFNLQLKDLQDGNQKIYLPENAEKIDFRFYGSIMISQKLLDYRSKIGFRFFKSDDADDFSVSDLQIIGAGSLADTDTVKLHPQRHQVITNHESSISLKLTDVRDSQVTDADGNKKYYDTDERNLISIVPGVYAPKDSVYKITGIKTEYLKDTDYITMKCELKQGERDPAHINLNFSQNQPTFKPQNKYIYNIVIRSNYIIMTVDVYDDQKFVTNGWEFGGNDSCEISNPDRITLGFWKIVQTDDKGWELVELDEQTIE